MLLLRRGGDACDGVATGETVGATVVVVVVVVVVVATTGDTVGVIK